jgi:phosphatidylserine/phosphatidylglycerophosphate/cardiolipin synthase-like enzyme
MRPRQWILSAFLFVISVVFLLYSKSLFPTLTGQSASTAFLPAGSDCQALLLPNEDYYPYLKRRFQEAHTSIIGTIYLVRTSNYPDNEPAALLRELIAASKRNVQVDLLLESSGDKDSVESNLRAAEMLRKAGVHVRLDSARVATHAKTFVIDGRYCFLGSHNFTHAAMSKNAELSIFVDSPDIAKKITDFIRQIPN